MVMKETELRNKCRTRVAIPYYGTLVRTMTGLERLYFLVDVGESGIPSSVALKVWNPRGGTSLPRWLKDQGIEGIICADEQPRYESLLQEAGIWVRWRQRGELDEVIHRWAGEAAV